MKKKIYLFSIFFLTACGFKPLIDKSETQEKGAKLIVKKENENVPGYIVFALQKQTLRNLKAANLSENFRVIVKVNLTTGSLSYSTQATSNRSLSRLNCEIIIRKNDQEVFHKKLQESTSYSQTADDVFMNQSAHTGATERLIHSMAQAIGREIYIFNSKSNTET